jgi:hypothetical protein
MKNPRFLVKLKGPHDKSGLSAYEVAKRLGLNAVTVRKWVSKDIEAEFLPDHVLKIVHFYGLDWRDPAVIEVIDSGKDESSGQAKTLLAALA